MAIKRRKKKKPKQPKKSKTTTRTYEIPQTEEEMMAMVGLAMNSEWAADEPELANAKLFDPFETGALYDEIWASLKIPDYTDNLSQEEQTGYFVQMYGELFTRLIDKKTQTQLSKIFQKLAVRFLNEAVSARDHEKVKALMGINYIVDYQPPAQWITIGALTTLIDQYVEMYHESLVGDDVSDFGTLLEDIMGEPGLINSYLFGDFLPEFPLEPSLLGEVAADDEELWEAHINGLLCALIQLDVFATEELLGLEAQMDVEQDVENEAAHNELVRQYLGDVSAYIAGIVTPEHRGRLVENIGEAQKEPPTPDDDRFYTMLLQHIQDDAWWKQYQDALYVCIFLGEGISLGMVDDDDDDDDEQPVSDIG